MELPACKLTHEQGFGGATRLRQRQSRPITCRVGTEVLSLSRCVTWRGLAAKSCYCCSCLLGRLALLGFCKMVQHKPSDSLNFVETKIDGKEAEEQDSLGFRPARIEPIDNSLNPKV